MKMVDHGREVEFRFTYVEAEKMWIILNALASDDEEALANLKVSDMKLAGKFEEKLDEYINT